MSYLSREEILEHIKDKSAEEALMMIVSHARNPLSTIISFAILLSKDEMLLQEALLHIQDSSLDLLNILDAATDYLVNRKKSAD